MTIKVCLTTPKELLLLSLFNIQKAFVLFITVHLSASLLLASCIILCCITTFSLIYTWDNLHGVVGAKSPVLFANKSEMYRCTVENAGQK